MNGTKAVLLGLAAAALTGCISAPDGAPEWYAERARAGDDSYPSLRDVPRTSVANTNQRHWDRVLAEVNAAAADMRANPRSAPASEAAQTPAEFIDEARRELEAARDAHPD